MRKQGKRRSVNYGLKPKAPVLVMRGINETALELRERLAVEAFAMGGASQEHFMLIQDVLNLLLIAGQSSDNRRYALEKAEREYKHVVASIQQQEQSGEAVGWANLSAGFKPEQRIVFLASEKESADRYHDSCYDLTAIYSAPINADLLVGAAYMAAAEAVKDEMYARDNILKADQEAILHAISTLTPDSARKKLERVCMECAGDAYQRGLRDAYEGKPESDDTTHAIVHQVLSKGGERHE